MKNTVIAMLLSVFLCISQASWASDIFGYWKSDEKPPFDYIQFTDKIFKSGKNVKWNIIRISNTGDKNIIYFVNSMYKVSDDDWKKLSSMSDAEIAKFASNIICTLTGDSLVVTTANNKTIKYSRITDEEGKRVLAD